VNSLFNASWFAGDGSHIAIVVAHQDDEVFLSSVLGHAPYALIVHVTDGAPEDTTAWKGATRSEYAAMRAQEADHALDSVGHIGSRVQLGVTDAKAIYHVQRIAVDLSALFTEHRTGVVVTHAYEGGHPDHDAVAMAVHTAARASKIVEAPFYRREGDEEVWQKFIPVEGCDEWHVELTDVERVSKADMIAAHKSQQFAIEKMARDVERFRLAPIYNFRLPPNDGNLLWIYEWAGIGTGHWDKY
jgi:N-acetylglucosamine malate deacetylase 2